MRTDGVPVSHALFARLRALGVDVPRTFRAAGLPVPAANAEPGRLRLTTQKYFALWDAIAQVSGDPAIGLRIGAETLHGQLDAMSLVALHSANFREALEKLARYKRLSCPEEVVVTVQRDEAAVTFRWLLANGFVPDLLADTMFASALAIARRGSGVAIKPRRVELTRRAANRAMFARHYGCEIVFDAPNDVLVFDAASLTLPFVTHNVDLLAAVVPQLDAGLAALAREQTFADHVDAALARSMCGQRPSVEALARELGISTRTLQRKLALDGTSYQQQLDRVRSRIARRLLGSTDLAAGEIAWFLGFEEVNSFSRAFNQWEGTTPQRWRGNEAGGRDRLFSEPVV
ncbi:AraC family transcriptional regulator [Caballeronia udeis]|uniref:AraC family transcriptional regulator n=1 Tax=Caballeronia udeis TaxID=1232866 RepID=A0A158FLF7_9BURK|nr:AraC family transcriptional regulator [Caballeronia udeis]SAL20595.1 AraC family transcriptional regulator [Caballeronia udeis]